MQKTIKYENNILNYRKDYIFGDIDLMLKHFGRYSQLGMCWKQ